ncbi:hypothetical protein BB558_006629, partial [Smittium angustum]
MDVNNQEMCGYVFLGPLSRIPGPLSARLFGAPYFFAKLTGQASKYLLKMHSFYGPIVRVSPNEVSVANTEAIKKIFSTHKFKKSVLYKNSITLTEDIFTTDNEEFNKMRRSQLNSGISQHNLVGIENVIIE